MNERIIATNPARGIVRRAANLPRERVLRDCELRLLLQGLRSVRLNTSPDLRMILQLLLLTGARSSEVGLEPGEPVFRWINKVGAIARGRRNDARVSQIVKTRLRALAIVRGKSKAEARKLVAAYSSDSMRARYATTAGEHDEPG